MAKIQKTTAVFTFLAFTLTEMVIGLELMDNNNSHCFYILNKNILECKNLTEIDDGLGALIGDCTITLFLKNFKNVYLDGKTLTNTNYEKVRNLHILSSGKFNVDNMGFSVFKHVENIRISKNEWREIKDDVFLGLSRLQVLDLAQNHLEILHHGSFKGLRKLESLDLSNNNLEILPTNCFEDVIHLKKLDLSNNRIRVLELNLFSGLEQLTNLNLANNNLNFIQTEQLNTLKNLESLSLNGNNMKTLSGEFHLYNLKFITLANNNLKRFSGYLFRDCKNIMSIDLSRNNLEDLAEEPFLDLPYLRHLTVTGNSISINRFVNLRNQTLVSFN